MPSYAHPKWYYQLVENFSIYLQAKKSTSSPVLFWRYYKDMPTSYFGYFWLAWLRKPKMIMIFICMSKINFVIHFFLETLYFKESCNLIIRQHFGPKLKNQHFPRVWHCWWKINNNNFVLDYFQEKLITNFFKKIKQTLFSGHFAQICAKMDFAGKKGLCQYFNIPIIYHRAKNQKKLMTQSWEKCRTDGRTMSTTNLFLVFLLLTLNR